MVFTDSAVSSAGAHHEPEDISLILRQLLRRSSSSSSSSSSPHAPPPPPPLPFTAMGTHAGDHHLSCFSSVPIPNQHHRISGRSVVFSGSDRLAVHRISDEMLSGVVLSSSPNYLSSESLTGSVQMTGLDDNEYAEECDCESEEAVEPAETMQHPPRNQSKRSRAAEVHNMSEKRRRSRINEKMKALQNLIPNSNKTDKASMLDEAIEYLKQLQLQFQMLSLRNGLSLHPMCLPGVPGILHPAQLSQIGMNLGHIGESLDMNMTNPLNMNTNTSDGMFNPPKQCASPGRPSLPNVSTAINSEVASFGVEPCILPNFGSFQPHDQAVCGERSVHQDHFTVNITEMKTPVTAAPLLFDIRESDVRGRNSLEGVTKPKYGSQEILW